MGIEKEGRLLVQESGITWVPALHLFSRLQFCQPFPFPALRRSGNQQPSGKVVELGEGGLINCFPKSFEDEGSSRREEGGVVQAGFQASSAANELGRQVVIKEKSPASGLYPTHSLPGAASGLCTFQVL